MENNYIFIRYLKGNWIAHNSIVSFETKRQKNSKNKIVIYENTLFSQNSNVNSLIIEADNKNKKLKDKIIGVKEYNSYSFYLKSIVKVEKQVLISYLKYIRKGFFEIRKISPFNKIKHKEYIYIVSQKVIIVISIIQNFKNHYLGAKISSYIKLKSICKKKL